jgi:hypothetical protein
MNKKVLSYEQAVEALKQLESEQIDEKRRLSKFGDRNGMMSGRQKGISDRRVIINLYVSIIAAHKQARKLYGKVNYNKKE